MEDDLDIALSILSLEDPEGVNRALEVIGTADPARAQQLQRNLQIRQQVVQSIGNLFKPNEREEAARTRGNQTARDTVEGVGQLASSLGLPNALEKYIDVNRNALSAVRDASFAPSRAITAADQFLTDTLTPERALQAALEQQSQAQLTSTDFTGNIDPNAFGVSLDSFNPGGGTASASAIGNQAAAFQQYQQSLEQAALEQQFNQARDARNALLLDSARQQGADIANQENLRRLGEQLALQQVPQVATNSLNNAAAFAQTPQIGSAPANVTQSLALTQALAPQTQVPSLQPAARTNIAQRQRGANINQAAQARLQQQQLKALELAMQQFQTQIARPILSERR